MMEASAVLQWRGSGSAAASRLHTLSEAVCRDGGRCRRGAQGGAGGNVELTGALWAGEEAEITVRRRPLKH